MTVSGKSELHKCAKCGREVVVTIHSIGTTHQWVAAVACKECISEGDAERGAAHSTTSYQTAQRGERPLMPYQNPERREGEVSR